jgi:hypothetical protein
MSSGVHSHGILEPATVFPPSPGKHVRTSNVQRGLPAQFVDLAAKMSWSARCGTRGEGTWLGGPKWKACALRVYGIDR